MRPTYKYGLTTGIISIILSTGFFLVVNWLNTNNHWGMHPDNIRGIGGILTIVNLGIGIYISMRSTKNAQNGLISYGQAVKAGVTVAIITAIIMGLWGYIYCEYINPDYAGYMVNEAHKTMIANGETTKQIAEHLVDERKQFSTGMQVFQALVGQFVVGTILSLIMALFIKTKKK